MGSLPWHSPLYSTPMFPSQTFNPLSLTKLAWDLPGLLLSVSALTLTFLRFNEIWNEGQEDLKAWNI